MLSNLLAVDLRQNFFGGNAGAQNLANSPGSLVSNLLPNILILAAIFFLFLIMGGGFAILANAGSGNAQNTAKGKAAITYGLIGFLLVVAAYFILQIIGYSTGINFTNLPESLN